MFNILGDTGKKRLTFSLVIPAPHLLVLQTWASYLTTWCLSFLICKTGIIKSWADSLRWYTKNIKNKSWHINFIFFSEKVTRLVDEGNTERILRL